MGERTVLIGILEAVRPRRILEFGTGLGGSTRVFDNIADEVVTVDTDNRCPELLAALRNTRLLQMTTQEAGAVLIGEGRHFDFVLIDAATSEEGLMLEVKNGLILADVVLCHNSYNPPCRRGLTRALHGRDVFYDLDFVPGWMHRKGDLWGGFALILPGLTQRTKTADPRAMSEYKYLRMASIAEIRFRRLARRLRKRRRSG